MKYFDTNIEKLNHLFLSEDRTGLEITRLLQMYLFNPSKEENIANQMVSNIPKSPDNKTGYLPIGTWHPAQMSGEVLFVRKEQEDSIFWESTCHHFSLKKKNNRKRVCLIGESAAAGMFFTPHITPSLVLANYLNSNSQSAWEVIDLTRNCMNAKALIETCEASTQLQPEFVVVMAGNNWFSDILIEHEGPIVRRRAYVEQLDKNGMKGMLNQYTESAETVAAYVFRQLNGIAEKSTANYIFAIPALNYKDWSRRYPLHWLDNGKTSDWYKLYRKAIHAVKNGEYETGLELGKEMIHLDEGENAASNGIIAACLIALNRREEAHEYCVAQCDKALLFDHITTFPGILSFVRKNYKNNDRFSDLKFIDLEPIFAEYINSDILDGTLFVDYSHLNPTGFHVAMAPVAAHILKGYSAKAENFPDEWKILLNNTSRVETDRSVLAISYLTAALYNTHLNRPLTNEFCINDYIKLYQRAVDCSSCVQELMEFYVIGRRSQFGAGFSMSKSGQEFFRRMNSPLDFPTAQEALGVDELTMECICRVLENNGRDGLKLLKEYHQDYMRLLDKGVDLTDPKYIEWLNSNVRMVMDSENSTRRKVPFYKSWWPCSFFSLISDKRDLMVEITCRIPAYINAVQNKKMQMKVNNQLIWEIPVNSSWTTHTIVVAKDFIEVGFNRLSLEWPDLEADDKTEILRIKERYTSGLNVNFYPVFGEVHSLLVRYKDDSQ